MTFEQDVENRNANTYADFFYPHLAANDRILDCGCGNGAISVGLAPFVPEGSVTGIDLAADGFQPALAYLNQRGVDHIQFSTASMLTLPFASDTFSACLCHSSIETLSDPVQALREIKRVLKPGGLIGVASVEYEGFLLAGPQVLLLRKFYAVREQLWHLKGIADPRLGKRLRGLLQAAGFGEVQTHARYLSYGNAADIRSFGQDRAADCEDPWYVENALAHQLLSEAELKEIQAAWQQWAVAPDAFAAFTWGRAIGRKIT